MKHLIFPKEHKKVKSRAEFEIEGHCLEKRGVILHSVREGVDYSTIAGRLVTQILVSVAEMERGLISERTKAALATKRALGIIGGRRPKFSTATVAKVREMRSKGLKVKDISKATGVSPSRISQLTKS